jgi:formylglycine-generating enzyme required for sulfatase activity
VTVQKVAPEMVVVKHGKFTMGAPAGEEARANLPNELRGLSVPQYLIKIQHKFAIGKFDVTRDEHAVGELREAKLKALRVLSA